MNTAQAILMGVYVAEAVAAGIPEAIRAKRAVQQMVAEGRDPTDEEWSELNATTAALRDRLQGDG